MNELEPNDPKLVDTDAAYTTLRQAASAAIKFGRKLGRTFDKDELVNEAYIFARENIQKYQPNRGPFVPWLFAIAIKHCHRYVVNQVTGGWDNGYRKDRPKFINFADWDGPVKKWESYIGVRRAWPKDQAPVGFPTYPPYSKAQSNRWFRRMIQRMNKEIYAKNQPTVTTA